MDQCWPLPSFVTWQVNGTAGDKTQGCDFHPSFSCLLLDKKGWTNVKRLEKPWLLSGQVAQYSCAPAPEALLRLSSAETVQRPPGGTAFGHNNVQRCWAAHGTTQPGQNISNRPEAAWEPLQTQERKEYLNINQVILIGSRGVISGVLLTTEPQKGRGEWSGPAPSSKAKLPMLIPSWQMFFWVVLSHLGYGDTALTCLMVRSSHFSAWQLKSVQI